MTSRSSRKVPEIVIVDDIEKCEKDVLDALLALPDKSSCRIIINSGGGSVYAGLSIASTIEMKRLDATAVVLADCSSSALIVFASCRERLVAPHASFLFHPMQWSSEERSRLPGAVGWAREFRRIESVCSSWIHSRLNLPEKTYRRLVNQETYVTAEEVVEMGMARYIPELVVIEEAKSVRTSRRSRAGAKVSRVRRARLAPAARHGRSRR